MRVITLAFLLATYAVCQQDEEGSHQSSYKDVNDTMSTAFQGNANDTTAILDKEGRIRIKVGHIGAVNALRNDAVVLELSRKSLRNERILDDDFDVE
ncbi:unnamed protein product [Heligmosomoides polygyrus]|uniref:Isoaspartyl peptidase/L-asparaginase n=1 Tax=Heligmosomoides polygyrus TaxID=6339 RepID=A0A183FQP3_HELPZ|nr:unnamed protein product [Heligmosomoides polygyrus]